MTIQFIRECSIVRDKDLRRLLKYLGDAKPKLRRRIIRAMRKET
jgi:hypothetical protein